jgi:pimeloyl-ACP methyl ester carboxylesterase
MTLNKLHDIGNEAKGPVRRLAFVAASVAMAALLGGCSWFSPTDSYTNSSQMSLGLVVVLPGIEGASSLNSDIARGLYDGGVDYAIEVSDWTSRVAGPIINERNETRNRRKAYEIAQHIAAYQITYPGRPVFVVGQSGGGAIAAWTAEALPAGHKIEGLVMLAPSLSPGYDLGPALAHCRRGILNHYSNLDLIFLGLGTIVTGTMDGEHTQSAGRVGFTKSYPGLYQIGWTREMAQSGNFGLHITSSSVDFVAGYVVPFIKAPAWDQKLVQSVLNRNGGAGGSQATHVH